MDFTLTKDEEEFRQEVRLFLDNELPLGWPSPPVVKALGLSMGTEIFADPDFFSVIAKKLAKKGWLGISLPREYGGQGGSVMKDLILTEEMAYRSAPGRSAILDLLCPILLIYGTVEQKRQFIPPITSGDVWWWFIGFTEPDAGSDLAAIQTRAIEEKDCYIVDGEKVFATIAHLANMGLVFVRTDPNAESRHMGISALIVDMTSPGISLTPLVTIGGLWELDRVHFDGVRVPKENLLGEKNRGWDIIMAYLSLERPSIYSVAFSRRVLGDLIEYIRVRERNDKSLASETIRDRIAQMAIEIEVARLMCYSVAWRIERGLDIGYIGSMTKLFITEMLQRLANSEMHTLGLYGQLDVDSKWAPLGGAIERLSLNTISQTIGGGTSEIQRNLIAQRGLGLPAK